VIFLQVLAIPENETRTVQLLVTPENEGGFGFKLIGFDSESADKNETYTVHVTGKISMQDSGKLTDSALDIQDIRERCPKEMLASEVYEMQARRGILLGPSYHWIDAIWKGDNEALCRMKSPEILKGADGYQLHPGLIDSCFGLLVTATNSDDDETYIPFRIKQFRFYRRAESSELWAYARVQENSEESRLSGDIQLFDENGQIIAEIIGLEGRKAGREAVLRGLRKNFSDWLYEVRWVEAGSREQGAGDREQGKWLIFSDRCGIGERLAERLEEQGEECLLVFSDTIDTKDAHSYTRLFAENPGNFRGIVYLADVEDIHLTRDDSQSSIVDLQSLLYLLQSMITAGWSQPPRLWLVTRGAVAKMEALHLEGLCQTPLWGLGRVVSLEHPEFRCTCTDVEPSATPEQNAQALFEELQISDQENQVVLRQGIRYVARLARAVLQETNGNLQFDENASYLITGGLGGLGLRIAEWMAERGAQYLVLTGRSGASKSEAQAAVKRLEASCTKVMVVKADVSLRDDVVRMFEEIKAAMPPLKGIIHAAGVLDDGMLRQQTYERFQRVIAPKADGAWHLHTLTLDMPLDFFVCFSSMTSLFGATAQGNYAAANAFMDGLAHYRRSIGLPGLSINWGPWAEAGMAATLTKRDQQRIAEQGLTSILPEQGLELLGELLKQEIAQVGVIPVNWHKFIQHFFKGVKLPFFEAFISPETQETVSESKLLRQLEAAEMAERRDLLIAHIRSLAAKVLDLNDPERIGLRQRLFDLGIDSLMAVDLKNRLEADLGHALRSTLVFDYPMVEAIADHLIEDVLSAMFSDSAEPSEKKEQEADTLKSELEDISEAEAEAMLLREIEKMEIN